MKKILCMLFLLLAVRTASTADLTGQEILKKVDNNFVAENRRITSTMIVRGRRGTRTIQSRSWVQGVEKAFSEYLSPPREAGTKMLKLKDELWIYSPDSDRTIKIAGHMLRRSLMGSDISYEDFMEDPKLSNLYEAKILGEETMTGRPTVILGLSAKKDGLAYESRKLWVDRERFVPLREERYAKSGKLLKTYEILEVFQVKDRWYPKRSIFKDALASGDGTENIIDTIEFDVDIPESVFSKASLR